MGTKPFVFAAQSGVHLRIRRIRTTGFPHYGIPQLFEARCCNNKSVEPHEEVVEQRAGKARTCCPQAPAAVCGGSDVRESD